MDEATAEARSQPDSGELMWHYTTLEALDAILTSNSLMATEVSYLNDISETQTADDAFDTALDQLSDAHPSFVVNARQVMAVLDDGGPFRGGEEQRLLAKARFILCASDDGDSLYAWRTYGDCAIGLDPHGPLGLITEANHRSADVHQWVPVEYDEDVLRAGILDELRTHAESWDGASTDDSSWDGGSTRFHIEWMELPPTRSRLRARAKNASFADEREHRVTIEPNDLKGIFTTPSGMGPRPRVRLRSAHEWGAGISQSAPAPNLPIRAIRLGPGASDSTIDGLRWMLLSHGYSIDAGAIEAGTYAAPEGREALPAYEDDWSETVIVSRSARPYRRL